MKRFVVIAMIGLFSVMMVGTVYSSFNEKVPIELQKDNSPQIVAILDAVTPSVAPKYGKMVTVLSEDVTL